MDDDVEVLAGGMSNADAVVRIGTVVHRPTTVHSPAIHALLAHLRTVGFEGAPELLGVGRDGREHLRFIPGEVAFPPFPAWADDDGILVSAARLLRRFHDAQRGFVLPAGATWSGEMADPEPGPDPVVCHNDLCLENIVVRSGAAVAILDLEFAAPGRRAWDVAVLARYLAPIDAPAGIARAGRSPALDPARRLRLAVDAYGLAGSERAEVVAALDEQVRRGGEFMRARAEAGEPAFAAAWEAVGGQARFDRRREWFAAARPDLLAVLEAP